MSTPTDGFPEPGERIGPYEIVRRLGVGGMGVVFEAVDPVLARRVALKVISPHLAGDPTFRARFVHEAQAQASLDSPHVVPVFAHGEADGALYLASQLIPDGDLGAMVARSGPLPPRTALDLVVQVAAGLAAAHATGLIHRDIKPANVLVRLRGEEVSAYLTDFGIARRDDLDDGLGARGCAVGTPSYLAPELHTGGSPGVASDVYSLGCLLWAALTGRAPYAGTPDFQLVDAHLSAPIPQLAGTGSFEREVNRVLRGAMAKHPRDRYPSAHTLRDDVRRVLRDHPAPAAVRPGTGLESPPPGAAPVPPPLAPLAPHGPPPAVAQPVPRRSRNPLLVALVLVAVILVVVGLVGAAFALRLDDDDDGGPSTSASDSTNENSLTEDEQTAADNIAAALVEKADFGPAEADCSVRKLVMRTGIGALQEQGIINEDLEFIADSSTGTDPGILTEAITVSVSCVFESVSIPTSN